MNHATHQTKLKILLQSYKDFMPICPDNQVLKLSAEIHKTATTINEIGIMTIDQLREPIDSYPLRFESKANFIHN